MKLSLNTNMRTKVLLFTLVFMIIFLTLGLHLPWSPGFVGMGPDSGLFAYAGQQILKGSLLYRDIFDHKTPGVFYLNALAIFLWGETPWAIWRLELIWIVCTMVVFFLVIRKLLGIFPALLASLIFLFTMYHPNYFQGGNLTEIYVLLPQVLIIGAYSMYVSTRRNKWITAIGLLTSTAFLFKPTNIALGLAAQGGVLYLDYRQRKMGRILKHVQNFIIGSLFPLFLVALYWGFHGALNDMWYAVITYNIQYSVSGLSIKSLYTTLRKLTIEQPMATVFTLSFASFFVFLVMNWNWLINHTVGDSLDSEDQIAKELADKSVIRNFVFVGVFASLPLELLAVSISGRNLGHYYLTLLPALSACSGYLFFLIKKHISKRAVRNIFPIFSLSLLMMLLFAWLLEVSVKDIPKREHLAVLWEQPVSENYAINDLDRYVLQNSDSSQSVLVWGIHPSINFISGRRSPSKYLFASHLLLPNTDNQIHLEEFLEDLYQDPPILILTQTKSSVDVPFLGSDEQDFCLKCPNEVREGMRELKYYFEEHYNQVKMIGDWVVYRRDL